MRHFTLIFTIMLMMGCSVTYQNKNVLGEQFPKVLGQSLEKETVNIPSDFNENFTLLLVGYKQNSQFDIDRWLIGIDMKQIDIGVYELPTIQGMFPRFFSTMIDNGMRRGIPKDLWKGVITIYKDGDKIQAFTGNENPNNARVLLINQDGKILFFHDKGFSVSALNSIESLLTR